MAEKTIPELQLKSSVVGDESMPADNGIQTYRITPSQMHDYMRTRFIFGAEEISNLTLTTAVGSSNLTIAVKTKAGADPSSSDPVRVGFRSATLTSGSYNSRTITGALSLVISSGSTLGQVSGQPSRIWVYLIDNAGTLELAASHKFYRDDALVSTTAEGGAGGADSATAIYSTSARSSVPVRLIGWIENTQATAGTWASAGSQIQLVASLQKKASTFTKITSGSSTYYTPAGCTRLRIRMVGGGGAGGSSGNGANGGNGGDTTFGSSLLACKGGIGGAVNSDQTTSNGTSTLNSPAVGQIFPGGTGGGGTTASSGLNGGDGAASPFGGAGNGKGGTNLAGGTAAKANSGSGGGGASISASFQGGGGNAGDYIEAYIDNPDGSYAYSIGAGGTPGSAGSGSAGGAGGSGIILIEEFYD